MSKWEHLTTEDLKCILVERSENRHGCSVALFVCETCEKIIATTTYEQYDQCFTCDGYYCQNCKTENFSISDIEDPDQIDMSCNKCATSMQQDR